jgi:predicted short-subunit dehydrogenase-like oxidoreductase (DUF2520 family)
LPTSAQDRLRDTDVILVAINDDAIPAFLAQHSGFPDRTVVHFSGARRFDGVHGQHPLMSFGSELYDLEVYRSIPFVSERGDAPFHEIFPGLANPTAVIDAELKPLYHALCVLSGNLTTVLWCKAMADFETRLGLPAAILHPYLRQVAANTLSEGGGALTGPLLRADAGTIEVDLAGLDGDPFGPVLEAAVDAYREQEARP